MAQKIETKTSGAAAATAAFPPAPARDPEEYILVYGLWRAHPHRSTALLRRLLTQEHLVEVYHARIVALVAGAPPRGRHIHAEDEHLHEFLFPEVWQSVCEGEGDAEYTAVHADDDDAVDDPLYTGDTSVIARNVPEVVTEAGLRAYITAGVEDEEVEIAQTKLRIRDAETRLVTVQKLIVELPNFKGTAETAEGVLELRRRRARELSILEKGFTTVLESLNKKLKELQGSAEELVDAAMVITPGAKDGVTKTAAWLVHFADTAAGRKFAYLAVHKQNWYDIWLAVDAGAGAFAAGRRTQDLVPHTHKMLDSNGIRFSCGKHGTGMYYYQDTRGDGEGRGYVSGAWAFDQPHGRATQLSGEGKFQGSFEHGKKRGGGTLIYTNGDVYTGEFGFRASRAVPSPLDGMEFTDGLPCGKGKMLYLDGSIAEGEFRDGMICGRAAYTDPIGTAWEGTFAPPGVLQGEGSAASEEVTLMGNFRRGLAHGLAVEMDARQGGYRGDVAFSVRHGFGRRELATIQGRTNAPHVLGSRTGAGIIEYGATHADTPASEASAPQHLRYRFFGRWRGERVRGGGVFSDQGSPGTDPTDYLFAVSNDVRNAGVPGFEEWIDSEQHVEEERAQFKRRDMRRLMLMRTEKEQENNAQYKQAADFAHENMVHVAETNARDRDLLPYRREMRARRALQLRTDDVYDVLQREATAAQ